VPLLVGFIFPSLTILFLPFLDFPHILTSQLLVEFMDSLDDVQLQIDRWRGFSFMLRLGFGSRLGSRFRLAFANLPLRFFPVLNRSTALRSRSS